jgi:septal ring factor EnvC (AmiA/AmiB activator)
MVVKIGKEIWLAATQTCYVSKTTQVFCLRDRIAKVKDATAKVKDSIAFHEDGIARTKDVIASLQDAIAKVKDSIASREDAIAEVKDVIVSLQDLIESSARNDEGNFKISQSQNPAMPLIHKHLINKYPCLLSLSGMPCG